MQKEEKKPTNYDEKTVELLTSINTKLYFIFAAICAVAGILAAK